MHKISLIRTVIVVAIVAALAAGCGGGSTTPSVPNSNSTPTPSPQPTSTSSSQSTYTFAGSSTSGNFAQGTTPGAVALSPYHNISVSIQFAAPTSGSGTLNVTDAQNSGDVTPNTLPVDNATAGYTPVIYVSAVNPGSTDINFGTNIPAFTITNSAGFGSAHTCELDVYGSTGSSSTLSWFAPGATGTISGNSVTVGPAQLSPGNTVDFKSGQQIVAVSCR